MIIIENAEVMNIHNAIRGARNPMNSWAKSDSFWSGNYDDNEKTFILGPNDLDLAKRLIKSGSDHRKFVRQIFVSVDITAPFYWWKEFDTYKVATVANSCSTMHKIHSKPITIADFSTDGLLPMFIEKFNDFVKEIEEMRLLFLNTESDVERKAAWRTMIQALPESYNQMRTVTLNYETLFNIYFARRNHKLTEWHEVCEWIETLPYMDEFLEVLKEKN